MLDFYWEDQGQLDAALKETRERLESARASGEHLDTRALRERLAVSSAASPVG